MALIITLSVNKDLKSTIEVRRLTNTNKVLLDPDDVSDYGITEYFPSGALRHGPVIQHRYGDSGEALAYEALKAMVDPD